MSKEVIPTKKVKQNDKEDKKSKKSKKSNKYEKKSLSDANVKKSIVLFPLTL